jgi:hypothetical protein
VPERDFVRVLGLVVVVFNVEPRFPAANAEDRAALGRAFAIARVRDALDVRHRSRVGAAALAGAARPTERIAISTVIFPRCGFPRVRL